jgi:hypothetical protein
MPSKSLALVAGLFACFVVVPAASHESLPFAIGLKVEVYADVLEPAGLAFDPSGILYVGNQAPEGKIRRIGVGGSPVEEFGDRAINNSDRLLVDSTGSMSGTAGSVLVTEFNPGVTPSAIVAVRPDQSTVGVFSGDPLFVPLTLAFDQNGRLIVSDFGNILVSIGDPFFSLVSGEAFGQLAIDAANRIFEEATIGDAFDTRVIRVFSSDGSLLVENFAFVNDEQLALGFAPFDRNWRGDLFAVSRASGILYRIDERGSVRKIGQGFGEAFDLSFGPDGALYISDAANDVIYRLSPRRNGRRH